MLVFPQLSEAHQGMGTVKAERPIDSRPYVARFEDLWTRDRAVGAWRGRVRVWHYEIGYWMRRPEQTPEPRAHFQAGHHLARSPVTIKSVLAHKARSCNGTCFQNCGWPRCSVWPCLHDRNASEARSFRMYRLHVPVSQRNLSWAWAQDVRGTTSKTAHTQTPKMTRIAAVLTHRQLVRASPA